MLGRPVELARFDALLHRAADGARGTARGEELHREPARGPAPADVIRL
ncbi:hypothetical protein OOK27_33280 [Streptomyces canus]|nr:hypothetical protein [Streptomyces canus]MCX5258953.1 hypothetical protein [Streptomyces canus]